MPRWALGQGILLHQIRSNNYAISSGYTTSFEKNIC